MSPELFAVGGAMLDCIVSADGALELEVLGGNAIHAAVGAAMMGARAGIVARVPRGWPVGKLPSPPLDPAGVRQEAAPMPDPEWFFHRADGSRIDRLHASVATAEAFGVRGPRVTQTLAREWEGHLIAKSDGESGWTAFRTAHPVLPQHVPEHWWTARGIHVAPGDPKAQLALARAGRAQGLHVTLDPGFATHRLDPVLLGVLLEACDVFLPSEAELHVLRPGLPPAAALAALARPGGPVLLAKLGRAGALLLDPADGEPRRLPALPVLAPDPTGAGDAFAGGVLAGLVRGETAGAAVRRGIVAGSFAVEQSGALAPLNARPGDVITRLQQLDRIMRGGDYRA